MELGTKASGLHDGVGHAGVGPENRELLLLTQQA
jgi:hypothetical protein